MMTAGLKKLLLAVWRTPRNQAGQSSSNRKQISGPGGNVCTVSNAMMENCY
jgi:hypothetical protein